MDFDGDDASDLCKIDSYRLVDIKDRNKELVSKQISLNKKMGSDIVINLDEFGKDNDRISFLLEARTMGNQVAYQQINLVVKPYVGENFQRQML